MNPDHWAPNPNSALRQIEQVFPGGTQMGTQIGTPSTSLAVGYGGNVVYTNPMLSTGGGLGQQFIFGYSRGGQVPRDQPSGSGSGVYTPSSGGYPPASGGYPPAFGRYPLVSGGYPPGSGGYPPGSGGIHQGLGGSTHRGVTLPRVRQLPGP